jgi:hypothetical protein
LLSLLDIVVPSVETAVIKITATKATKMPYSTVQPPRQCRARVAFDKRQQALIILI